MTLLKMSGAGAFMILAAAAVRALAVNRLPKKTFMVLWFAALARLLIPYSLPCAFSAYSLAPAAEAPAVQTATAGGITAVGVTTAPGAQVPTVSSQTHSVDGWTVVWLAGMAICAAYFGAAYLRCRRKFRESTPLDNNAAREWIKARRLRRVISLRQSERISAPLTYGVLRPVILMPKAVDWRDADGLRFALAHEYVHIRRFDALTKLALTAAVCVHWFNPAVWLMYALANRDIELSCDEAVVRLFGTGAKASYAMALIRMEEVRSGLTPLCSHFSGNVMEERIIAIMKMKKTTWAALLAAAVVVTGVTTAFATSARQQNREDVDRALNGVATYEEQTMMSYTNPDDGKTYYSDDDGQTWTPMTDAEFQEQYPTPDVEWWTAEEYADWLENEKAELWDMIGERGWTPSTGWFTWDQRKVDETILMYEGILDSIRNGVLVSKSVDGNENIMLSIGTEESGCAVMEQEDRIQPAEAERTQDELLALYGPFGISFSENGDMLYNGKTVRAFVDGAEVGDGGYATHYVYRNDLGEVYLRAVRGRVENGDGSFDPFGPLTGLVECDPDDGEILAATSWPVMEAVTSVTSESDADGQDFLEMLRQYEPFGVVYVQKDGYFGNLYYNGDLVDVLVDRAPDGSYMTVGSIDDGGVKIHTVYDDNGALIGVTTYED